MTSGRFGAGAGDGDVGAALVDGDVGSELPLVTSAEDDCPAAVGLWSPPPPITAFATTTPTAMNSSTITTGGKEIRVGARCRPVELSGIRASHHDELPGA